MVNQNFAHGKQHSKGFKAALFLSYYKFGLSDPYFIFVADAAVCGEKGPGTLNGVVKLWMSCVFLVLPGLQMNSKADHNPHAK